MWGQKIGEFCEFFVQKMIDKLIWALAGCLIVSWTIVLNFRATVKKHGIYSVLTESVEKKTGDPGVDGKYPKDYPKHKKEKRFLIYTNVTISVVVDLFRNLSVNRAVRVLE